MRRRSPGARRAVVSLHAQHGRNVGTGEDQTFVSAALWRRDSGSIRQVASVGASPGLDGRGGRGQAILGGHSRAPPRSWNASPSATGCASPTPSRILPPGTSCTPSAPSPCDRRAPVDGDSAYADLNYAIYLGKETKDDLSTTNVDPADLPLDGTTYRTEVPFGDTVLTLVTSPRRHLGSTLSQRLPLVLAIGGLLLTALAAVSSAGWSGRAVRRRRTSGRAPPSTNVSTPSTRSSAPSSSASSAPSCLR